MIPQKTAPRMLFLSIILLVILACSLPGNILPTPLPEANLVATGVAQTKAAQTMMAWYVQGSLQAPTTPALVQNPPVIPSNTPTPTPTATTAPNNDNPVPPEPGCTDSAELLKETIEDGTVYPPHINFVKSWVLKNAGTCTWTTDYTLNFLDGDQMEASASVKLPNDVQPGKSAVIAVNMKSPVASGTYRGNWILKNASGESFGWGPQSTDAFWVEISVDEQAMAVPDPGSIDTSTEVDLPARGGGVTPPDTDGDGLNDYDEEWFANTFVPILQFAGGEDVPREQVMRFYQVVPIYKTSPDVWNYYQYQFPEYWGPPGVLITYVVAYTWDTGDPVLGIESHAGDAEAIRIFLVNPRNAPYTWNPVVIVIKRHFDDPEFYYTNQFEWSGSHPIVWVSENKHAMYSSWEECDDYSAGFEYCGCYVGLECNPYMINYPIVSGGDGFNVGERLSHPFSKVPPNSLGLFGNEFVWSAPESILPEWDVQGNVVGNWDQSEVFCGGQPISVKCGGGMNGKWWPMTNPKSQTDLAWYLAYYANRAFAALYGAEYEVCFYTGNVDHAGTDFFVDIELSGTAHTQVFNVLDNDQNNFEKGKIDCFRVGSYHLEEKITSLKIYAYMDFDDDNEWFLERVTVKELMTGEFWNFDCNCWIGNGGLYDDDIDLTPLSSPVTLQPDQ